LNICIDLSAATLTLSGFRPAPRIGLERAKRVFRFIRNCKKISIKFRTNRCDHSAYTCIKLNFGYVYHPCNEEIPDDVPTPKGKSIQLTTVYVANLLFEYILESLLLISSTPTTILL
jgi:hypothetical protein